MKRQIRRGVYETNSSSTHSLTMCSEEDFEQVVNYQMATCERMDIIGAGAHTVDILRKPIEKMRIL